MICSKDQMWLNFLLKESIAKKNLVGYKSSEPCTRVSHKLFLSLQSLRCDTSFFDNTFGSFFKEEQYDQ